MPSMECDDDKENDDDDDDDDEDHYNDDDDNEEDDDEDEEDDYEEDYKEEDDKEEDDDDDVAVSFQEGGFEQRPLASHPGAILACLKQWRQNNRKQLCAKTAALCFALHASAHYWQLKVTTVTGMGAPCGKNS